ncbi:hypothetical protein MIR68_002094 [Amoeboaphelidium protococcarum]|nr:hypothetical protein MIR68_002094 [Amoeboaphelidium protococcarum]
MQSRLTSYPFLDRIVVRAVAMVGGQTESLTAGHMAYGQWQPIAENALQLTMEQFMVLYQQSVGNYCQYLSAISVIWLSTSINQHGASPLKAHYKAAGLDTMLESNARAESLLGKKVMPGYNCELLCLSVSCFRQLHPTLTGQSPDECRLRDSLQGLTP